MNKPVFIYCTVPDHQVALKISRVLVEKKLAACVNCIPGITSVYTWNKEVCEEPEELLIVKSFSDRFASIKNEILSLHPYEVPEIVEVPCNSILETYATWMEESVEQ